MSRLILVCKQEHFMRAHTLVSVQYTGLVCLCVVHWYHFNSTHLHSATSHVESTAPGIHTTPHKPLISRSVANYMCIKTQQRDTQEASRPYLTPAGIQDEVEYIHTMNLFQSKLLASAKFVEADITYNESREHQYLFNLIAADGTTMKWTVVSRV